MKMIIGADLVPTASNNIYFRDGNIDEIIDPKIIDILNKADYRVFNLEAPLTDKFSPISKAGPALSCPTNVMNGIKKINVNFFTLANNHIFDQGEEALILTTKILEKNNISFAGVGDISNSSKTFFVELNGIKIGIYCCCEHEFSVVDDSHIGANPFDPLTSLDEIQVAKTNCDHLIVLYHGGREHYRYPSPYLQKTCRKIIEKGASLVVCQHSHCVGCMENYQNGTIVYGQGNFLFDYKDNEHWETSLLLEVDFSKKNYNIKYHPIKKNNNAILFGSEDILNGFLDRSREIVCFDFVKKKYDELSKEKIKNIILSISGKNTNSLYFKILNKISRGKYKEYQYKKYYNKYKNRLINLIDCEAHRELMLNGLKIND